MGRDHLRIVDYSEPEPQVPASEDTCRELSPYLVQAGAPPRVYPKTLRSVNPHLPPIERMPVPVTPFPKLFRDDPEPA